MRRPASTGISSLSRRRAELPLRHSMAAMAFGYGIWLGWSVALLWPSVWRRHRGLLACVHPCGGRQPCLSGRALRFGCAGLVLPVFCLAHPCSCVLALSFDRLIVVATGRHVESNLIFNAATGLKQLRKSSLRSMSLTIDTTIKHGRVVGTMVNYGFGMPTRLVADGNVARWCGRLVAHYGRQAPRHWSCWEATSTRVMSLFSAALGSLDRALLERILFRCGLVRGEWGDDLVDEAVALATDEGVDFVLAIGDADTASFGARTRSSYHGVLDAGEDGFVPLRVHRLQGKVPASCGCRRGSCFAIIAPNCWRASGLPCASCSVAYAPRHRRALCHICSWR